MDNNKAVKGYISGISGPVVFVKGNEELRMLEMVLVGEKGLVGEVISVENDRAVVQVYETTTGLRINEPVAATGSPLSVDLGPGILGGVFDGIQRPLKIMEEISGPLIDKGIGVHAPDRSRKWKTRILVKAGDKLKGGSIIAEVQETPALMHKVMLPPGKEGTVKSSRGDGEYNIEENIIEIEN
ncbi:MAG: hypothetical protein JXB33_06555, partial [Clostridia bacterium]|nr:hypothetical protein [Clostridia bacterium]